MKKLLSICIPTFNRAKQLNKQLAWLAQDIKGFEDDCEIIVSDNCSNDETQSVIKKWQSVLIQTTFKSNKHDENIGCIRNITYCLNVSTSRFTWIIGDDDLIFNNTLAYVISKLKSIPDLALLYLNFSDLNRKTGEVISEHWFDTNLDNNKNIYDGKVTFQHCIEKNFGSVIFLTATIYCTELAQTALQKWSIGMDNWGYLAYLAGYCAAQGNILVTKNNYIECTMGVSYWQEDPRAWFKILHKDIPEIYLKLQEIGYPHKFYRQMILNIVKEDLTKNNLFIRFKYYLWCFIHWPLWSINIIIYFLFSLFSAIFNYKSLKIITNFRQYHTVVK
ncbi:glycosyltransferase family 2 protein [Chlorogloeopsis sp. ULAP01]|uniref:glycosyltransferase family 2 protein n=1 Tax=Chlorogloeopsis sp. ULAP01 TaxID=3056483 RepID=UPI0025AA83EA|nr:glycosyltransferase family 2 protein [Chlorogloeopsis sp. ULAP01]MDM9382280.1 glycosyltransferase family 2 protein [Chlorogloeopsis sp. ULAP01]